MNKQKSPDCQSCDYRHTDDAPCPGRVAWAVLWDEHHHLTSADQEFMQEHNLDEHNVLMTHLLEYWIARELMLKG